MRAGAETLVLTLWLVCAAISDSAFSLMLDMDRTVVVLTVGFWIVGFLVCGEAKIWLPAQ
jgi:hypothetical protein